MKARQHVSLIELWAVEARSAPRLSSNISVWGSRREFSTLKSDGLRATLDRILPMSKKINFLKSKNLRPTTPSSNENQFDWHARQQERTRLQPRPRNPNEDESRSIYDPLGNGACHSGLCRPEIRSQRSCLES